MPRYLILTSKPGQYRSDTAADLPPVEAYEYRPEGRVRARFVLAELRGATHVRIVDDNDAAAPVNRVPVKFLPTFDGLDAARAELRQLCRDDGSDTVLRRLAPEPELPAVAPGQVRVTFVSNAGKVVVAAADSNLLRISLREKGGIPFKCGGGLCGTCRCRIESGREHTDEVKAKERRHLSEDDLASGLRMACQTFVRGDIAVSW